MMSQPARRATITTTAEVQLPNPTLGDLRAFVEATAELPDDARVDARPSSDQRDGRHLTLKAVCR